MKVWQEKWTGKRSLRRKFVKVEAAAVSREDFDWLLATTVLLMEGHFDANLVRSAVGLPDEVEMAMVKPFSAGIPLEDAWLAV